MADQVLYGRNTRHNISEYERMTYDAQARRNLTRVFVYSTALARSYARHKVEVLRFLCIPNIVRLGSRNLIRIDIAVIMKVKSSGDIQY